MQYWKYFSLSLILTASITLPSFADKIDDTLSFNNMNFNTYNSYSLSDDVTAAVVNPGGIGVRGYMGELFFSNSIMGLNSVNGFNQTNLFLSYGSINLAYQQFSPQLSNLKPLRKYIAGFGYPVSEGLNVGISYSNVQESDNSNVNVSSFDIGLLARPVNFISLGLAIKNISSPTIGRTQIARTYAGSLGIRPGTERLTLTLDGEWVEGSTLDRAKGSIGFDSEFLDGVILRGKASSNLKDGLKGITWGADLGFNLPNIALGYSLNSTDKGIQDAAYAKLTIARNKTLFDGSNERFAEINFDGNIEATKSDNFSIFSQDKKNSVYDYIQTINKAKNDKDIAGIVLNINSFSGGIGVNEEIRNKIKDFKKSGKKVVAYIRGADLLDYYLASVADYIVIHPIGELELLGVASSNLFYKDLMGKFGVKAQYISIGKYKSAGEPYTRSEASEPEKEQLGEVINDFYTDITQNIADDRKIDLAQFKSIIDKKSILMPTDAKDLKLVDQVAHYDEMGKICAKLFNLKGQFPIVDISEREYYTYDWKNDYKIAIVNASGAIVEGESQRDFMSGQTTMGADTVAKLLKKARENKSIKAVVFRIDSGGGSAIASDIISRELEKYKEENKPIVVSMANVAGSGGYWISSQADKIVANSNCITGSIGVITGKVNLEGLFKLLGVNAEVIKKGENADIYSQARPFTDKEKGLIENSIKSLYRTFLERVSSGRNINILKVEELAQGRIYSGKRAKELNLIDEIGGLESAIEIAKNLASLKDERTKTINVESDFDLVSTLSPSTKNTSFYPLILMNLVNSNRVLAIMPNFEF